MPRKLPVLYRSNFENHTNSSKFTHHHPSSSQDVGKKSLEYYIEITSYFNILCIFLDGFASLSFKRQQTIPSNSNVNIHSRNNSNMISQFFLYMNRHIIVVFTEQPLKINWFCYMSNFQTL